MVLCKSKSIYFVSSLKKKQDLENTETQDDPLRLSWAEQHSETWVAQPWESECVLKINVLSLKPKCESIEKECPSPPLQAINDHWVKARQSFPGTSPLKGYPIQETKSQTHIHMNNNTKSPQEYMCVYVVHIYTCIEYIHTHICICMYMN